MVEYLKLVGQLMSEFHKARVVQVSRGKNRHANSLATLASFMDDCVPRLIIVEVLSKPRLKRLRRYEGLLHGSGYPMTKGCTGGHLVGLIYYASIYQGLMIFSPSCIREYVGVM